MKSSVAVGLFSTGESAASAMVAGCCQIQLGRVSGLTVPALPLDRRCAVHRQWKSIGGCNSSARRKRLFRGKGR
jgi:hypothetical protein